MRKLTIPIMLSPLSMLLLLACSTTRPATTSRIGLVPLPHYTHATANTGNDTIYRVIRSNNIFTTDFKATGQDAKAPDFNGQTVVAILLPAAPTGPALRFERGEISGNTLLVYAVNCSPGADPTCHNSVTLLATAPKNGNVKKVQFFINGTGRRTIDL